MCSSPSSLRSWPELASPKAISRHNRVAAGIPGASGSGGSTTAGRTRLLGWTQAGTS